MATTWYIRLGSKGEYDRDALQDNLVSINYGIDVDLDNCRTRESIDQALKHLKSGQGLASIQLNQIHRFLNQIQKGDQLVSQFKTLKTYGYGLVEETRLRVKNTKRPAIRVNWLSTNLTDEDLQISFWKNAGRSTVKAVEMQYPLSSPLDDIAKNDLIDDDFSALEGALRRCATEHRRRERNQSIVKKRKERAEASSRGLICDICDLNFAEAYPTVGAGYIECHHKGVLSSYDEKGGRTHPHDLALLCANCHRMVHRRMAKYPDSNDHIEELKREMSFSYLSNVFAKRTPS